MKKKRFNCLFFKDHGMITRNEERGELNREARESLETHFVYSIE